MIVGDGGDVLARVAELSDERAVAVLALVLDRQRMMPDPFSQEQDQQRLEAALGQPEIVVEVAGGPETRMVVEPVPGVTDGDLARTALTYLADSDPATAALVEQAMDLDPVQETRDLGVLLVGALVLMAFHADIEVAKDPGKGWKFRFKTTGLKESTIGKLLGQLMGNFLNSGQ